MSNKSFMERALELDHRILASIVFVIITAMLLYPLSIPFPVSSYGQNYYNFVESIPPDTVVGFMMGETPSTKPQLMSSTVITTAMLWEKNDPVVVWYDYAICAPLVEGYLEEAKKMVDREIVYGVDYVNLGYIAGEETGQAAFLKDIRQVTAGKDLYGNNLDDLPMMEGVNSGNELKYGFANCACYCTEPMYVRQWQMVYDAKIATIGCAMALPGITIYLSTGQLQGTANGLLGSAEVEYLTGNLGLAYGQTLAVSFTGLYFTVLVILGNIFFFALRSRGGET
jgi:hypothetical protein